MHVLFVTPHYKPDWHYGGIVRAIDGWSQALALSGVKVTVFATTDGDRENPVVESASNNGGYVEVRYYARSSWFKKRFVSAKLLSDCLAEATHFDVVHTAALWNFPAAAASYAAAYRGVPYVVSLHGTLMPWAYQKNNVRKRLSMTVFEDRRLRRARKVICESKVEETHFLNLGLGDRTTVIPDVIDPGDIQPEPASFRARHNLQDAFIFLFSGRRVVNKGLHFTIQAFARIAGAHHKAHLVVVGPEGDALADDDHKLVRRLGLATRVTFTGLLTGQDYWDAMASANVFVLNSYSENFGASVAEAMAVGVPVLISDQVGIADIVARYEAGVITPNEVAAISEGMETMLSGPDHARAMGDRGRSLVRENFSLPAVGSRLVREFEQVVGTSGRCRTIHSSR